MKQAMEKLVPLVRSEEGKRTYAEVERTDEAFRALANREIQLRREGNTKEAITVMSTEAGPAFAALSNAVGAFDDHLTKSKEQVDKARDDNVASGKVLILSLCAAGIVLGLLVAMTIVRSLTGAIFRMLDLI